MQSAWFGGTVMLLMLVGLAVWIWWAVKKDKKQE
jgi:hypothetical protein